MKLMAIIAELLAVSLTPTAHAQAAAPRLLAVCEQSGVMRERVQACTLVLQGGALSPQQEAMIRVDRAWGYSQSGLMGAAHADYDRAVELAPDSYVVANERALFFLRLGDLTSALRDYDTAEKLNADVAYPHYGRGIALLRSGNSAAGQGELATARRLQENVDQIFRTIGMTP